MTPSFKRTFELSYVMRTELNEPRWTPRAESADLEWLPDELRENGAEFSARERRLFEALRRSPGAISRLLADSAAWGAAFEYEPSEHTWSLPEPYAHLVATLPAAERAYFTALDRVEDDADWKFPFEWAFVADVTQVRVAPHAPLPVFEGPVPLPLQAWHRVALTIDARFSTVPYEYAARVHQSLLDKHPTLACATVDEFRDRIQRVVDALALDIPRAEAYLKIRAVRDACDGGVEPLLDTGHDDELEPLMDRVSVSDRRYYERARAMEMFYDVTEGVRVAARTVMESYEVRMVA